MQKQESEVRGMRLVAGYLVIAVFSYWFFTGRVWLPFSETIVNAAAPQTAMASRGADGLVTGPISDAYAIFSAIAYVVGTFTVSGLIFAWSIVRELFSATRNWVSGGQRVTDSLIPQSQNPLPATTTPAKPVAIDRTAALEAAMAIVTKKLNEQVAVLNAHTAAIKAAKAELARLEEAKSNRRGATK